jgi:murein DD-endopeptidase MepM/ murein hydrolase activator NlpD
LLHKHLAELGQVAGWRAGVAFAALAATVAAIPAAANANLPALKPLVLSMPQAKPAAPVVQTPPAPPAPAFAFADPLPGREIGSPFGLRELPWEARGRLHEGVDIAAPTGEAVHATLPGVVVRTGVSQSYGRFVEVAHSGGLTSFYAHLKSAAAHMRPGHIVAGEDVVGYVGDTGHSTGPHLHFEIRRRGAPLNPAVFIDHQFMTAASLPIRKAAAVGRLVRIAHVSGRPGISRARREPVAVRRGGRMHAVIVRASEPRLTEVADRSTAAEAPKIGVGSYRASIAGR